MLVMPMLGLGGDLDLLVNDIGLGAIYTATQAGALAEITLTIKTDGTWAATAGSGDVLGGTPTTGTWLHSSTLAAQYEVMFSNAGDTNSPVITNGASSFTAVSVDRSFKVARTNADASTNMTVQLRKVGGGRIVSDTATMDARGSP